MCLLKKLFKPKPQIRTVVIDTNKKHTQSWILGETNKVELSDTDMCIEDED